MMGMNILRTIKDEDFGLVGEVAVEYRDRSAARAVVFDGNGNVALLHARKFDYHKLPGGGVDEGEEIADALMREVLEEIGCAIKNVRELGVIEEFRNENQLHQISYCFLADLAGEKGEPHYTESEIEEQFIPDWMPFDEAIKKMEEELARTDNYAAKFMTTRELTFLKAARIAK